jgi:hypothetical protein
MRVYACQKRTPSFAFPLRGTFEFLEGTRHRGLRIAQTLCQTVADAVKVYLQKIRQIGKVCVQEVCGIEAKTDKGQRGARHIGASRFSVPWKAPSTRFGRQIRSSPLFYLSSSRSVGSYGCLSTSS